MVLFQQLNGFVEYVRMGKHKFEVYESINEFESVNVGDDDAHSARNGLNFSLNIEFILFRICFVATITLYAFISLIILKISFRYYTLHVPCYNFAI